MGVLFIIMQQVHPALAMQLRQSQQAWIISPHLASPLVQVMHTPLAVISQWHMPMVKLQQQVIIPFIIMQQLTMPPCNIMHRFCIMLQAIGSSHEQVIFIPPWHFSNFMWHRGTIIQLAGIVLVPPFMGVPMLAVPMPAIEVRSIITLAMSFTPSAGLNHSLRFAPTATAGIIFRDYSAEHNGTAIPRQLPSPLPKPLGWTLLSKHYKISKLNGFILQRQLREKKRVANGQKDDNIYNVRRVFDALTLLTLRGREHAAPSSFPPAERIRTTFDRRGARAVGERLCGLSGRAVARMDGAAVSVATPVPVSL
jgi:hypothetical protein